MKIIQWINLGEGEASPRTTFIALGRKIQGERYNGFYLTIRLFRPRKVRKIIDTMNFQESVGPTYTAYYIMARRPANRKRMKFFMGKAYCPA